MKRFKFRLGGVAREREIRERERQRDLALALKEQQKTHRELFRLQEKGKDMVARSRSERSRELLSPVVLMQLEHYGKRLALETYALLQQLEKCKAFVRECQDKLAIASRRKKVMTRLKERQEWEYYQEAEKDEQKVLDEMSVMQFGGGKQHG